jgi:nucleoside diphosphate kinase
MFAPSRELICEYADQIVSSADPQNRQVQEWIRDYVVQNLGPHPSTGHRRRVMMLIFRGEEAVRKVRSVVGSFCGAGRGGETIRDSFGDLILDDQGRPRYFEPAVLAAPNPEEAAVKLRIWAKYSSQDGGIVPVQGEPDEDANPSQRTLVLIKPDNFRFPSGRPGNVIDFFSRTGLAIVAIKVHRMSVADAVEFYGPVREFLRTKLVDRVGQMAAQALKPAFGFDLDAATVQRLGECLGPAYGDWQFGNIVEFMSGSAPGNCPSERLHEPGSEKCIALVYEGPDAIRKIRDVLGPTDPSKAPPGSIRREFGSSVMVNAAHASDAPENAAREMAIIKLGQENVFQKVVEEFYSER